MDGADVALLPCSHCEFDKGEWSYSQKMPGLPISLILLIAYSCPVIIKTTCWLFAIAIISTSRKTLGEYAIAIIASMSAIFICWQADVIPRWMDILAIIPLIIVVAAIVIRIRRAIAFGKSPVPSIDEIICQYNKILEINPWNAEALNYRGQIYYHTGSYEHAISDFSKALSIKPEMTDAYVYRGVAYNRVAQYDRAVLDFTTALDIDPTGAEAYFLRGNAHYWLGQFDRAIKDYGSCLDYNLNHVNAHYNRGVAAISNRQYALAISDFDRVLERNSSSVKALNNRAIAFRNTGNLALSLQDCNRALGLAADAPCLYNNRGLVYYDYKDYAQAIRDFESALKIDSEYSQAHYNRAITLERLGRIEQATEAYNAFVASADPSYSGYVEKAKRRISAFESKMILVHKNGGAPIENSLFDL